MTDEVRQSALFLIDQLVISLKQLHLDIRQDDLPHRSWETTEHLRNGIQRLDDILTGEDEYSD